MNRLRLALEQMWWRTDAPAWHELLLWPLTLCSFAYRLGAFLHRALARPVRAAVPVISIGSLVAGGSGKTPLVELVCTRLLARGRRPAVLSRGYGRVTREPLHVANSVGILEADPARAGDEPLELAHALPGLHVWVGPDRARLAPRAIAAGADVLVLDDGLQHHALARDLDLVLRDGRVPLGNGRFLPRGPMREHAGSLASRTAPRVFAITRADASEPAGALLDESVDGPAFAVRTVSKAPRQWQAVRAFLLTGIARPGRVHATLAALGAEVRGARAFADHHRFTRHELAEVRSAAQRAGASIVVTTGKDLARIPEAWRAGEPPLSAVTVRFEILRGEQHLEAALDAALMRRP